MGIPGPGTILLSTGGETMPRTANREETETARRGPAEPARTVAATAVDPAATAVLRVFHRLFRDYHPRDFTLRLWNGTEWPAETPEPKFVWILRHPGAPRRMFRAWNTDVHLGESYIHDDFDLEGDLQAAFRVGDWLVRGAVGWLERLRLGWALRRLPKGRPAQDRGRHAVRLRGRLHSRERDRAGIAFHYDRSNEFFALWLDRRLVYSCAYFDRPDDDLDTAQERKLDYVCRKLRLRPGEKLLDVGCGWGGLVMHAAERYGVNALGITISRAQAEVAKQRIAAAGLEARCRARICDYRDVEADGGFDKMVSIGMVEHVGERLLPTYFRKAWDALRPGGAFLNHGIVWRASERRLKGDTFDKRFVFPDGRLTTLHEVVRCAERTGFEVRDVESLREHYALTLQHWVRRLEERRREAREQVDEATYRIWRLYMAGAAHAFSVGRLNVVQMLLVKPDDGRSRLPLTRADWYRP